MWPWPLHTGCCTSVVKHRTFTYRLLYIGCYVLYIGHYISDVIKRPLWLAVTVRLLHIIYRLLYIDRYIDIYTDHYVFAVIHRPWGIPGGPRDHLGVHFVGASGSFCQPQNSPNRTTLETIIEQKSKLVNNRHSWIPTLGSQSDPWGVPLGVLRETNRPRWRLRT